MDSLCLGFLELHTASMITHRTICAYVPQAATCMQMWLLTPLQCHAVQNMKFSAGRTLKLEVGEPAAAANQQGWERSVHGLLS